MKRSFSWSVNTCGLPNLIDKSTGFPATVYDKRPDKDSQSTQCVLFGLLNDLEQCSVATCAKADNADKLSCGAVPGASAR